MKTNVVIVLDKSGSMEVKVPSTDPSLDTRESELPRRIDRAITDYNQQIQAMKDEVKRDSNLEILVSLVLFDSTVGVLFENLPLDQVEELKVSQVRPSGGTAMFDAIKRAIEIVEPEIKNPTDAALIVTITDGDENGSSREARKYTPKKIKELEATDAWTFTYLGAEISMDDFQDLGSVAGNTMTGLGNLGTQTTAGMHGRYFGERSRGSTSSKNTYGK
jgi:uncharacterized protein YegL